LRQPIVSAGAVAIIAFGAEVWILGPWEELSEWASTGERLKLGTFLLHSSAKRASVVAVDLRAMSERRIQHLLFILDDRGPCTSGIGERNSCQVDTASIN